MTEHQEMQIRALKAAFAMGSDAAWLQAHSAGLAEAVAERLLGISQRIEIAERTLVDAADLLAEID